MQSSQRQPSVLRAEIIYSKRKKKPMMNRESQRMDSTACFVYKRIYLQSSYNILLCRRRGGLRVAHNVNYTIRVLYLLIVLFNYLLP